MLTLAFTRGLISGRNYATALLKPACTRHPPRNPYWHPLRWLCYRMGFSLGVYEVLHRD